MIKLDTDALDENIITMFQDKWAILTVGKKEDANPMTISWGQMGYLWNKCVATIYVRPQRYTKELLDKYDTFTLSILDEKYQNNLSKCGKITGRNIDKFAECELNSVSDIDNPYTYVKEADVIFKCKILYETKLNEENFLDKEISNKNYPNKDFHYCYIAEIKQVLVSEDYFKLKVKINES